MLSDRNNMLIMTAAILSVATMMVAPVSVGFATSYTATTQSTGNEITTDYFTVGMYLKNNTDYVASSNIINTSLSTLRYEDVNGRHMVGGSANLTKDNVFFKIDDNGGNQTYTRSSAGTITDSQGTVPAQWSIHTYTYGGETADGYPIWNQTSTFVAGTYYKLVASVFFENAEIHGTPVNNKIPVTVSLSITLTRSSPLNGSYIPNDGTISIAFTANSDAQAIINDNDSDNLNGFGLIDASDDTSYTSGGQDCQAVMIDNPNSEGITSGGRAELDVKIPANTKFIVAIDGSGGNKHNTITVTITATGINYTETTPLRNDIYLTTNGTSNSMPNPTPNSNWFVTTDSSGINIHFLSENSNGGTDSAKAYIVLCPSTT